MPTPAAKAVRLKQHCQQMAEYLKQNKEISTLAREAAKIAAALGLWAPPVIEISYEKDTPREQNKSWLSFLNEFGKNDKSQTTVFPELLTPAWFEPTNVAGIQYVRPQTKYLFGLRFFRPRARGTVELLTVSMQEESDGIVTAPPKEINVDWQAAVDILEEWVWYLDLPETERPDRDVDGSDNQFNPPTTPKRKKTSKIKEQK
jgi:hypothetical protein